jgi:PKD repeat protein
MMIKKTGMLSRFKILFSLMLFSVLFAGGIVTAGLNADFLITDECGLQGLEFPDGDTLTLTDATTTIGGENVVSWSWNTNPVHPGYPSYDENPPVISPVIGPASFDVTLTVTGSQSSSSTVTKTVTIFNDPWISANFSYIVDYDKDPLLVRFIDQSETSGHNIIKWYWNISGTIVDDVQMPNVTLPDGVNNVTLVIVTDQGEYARVTKSIGIHSLKSDLPPISDFMADKTRFDKNPVTFTDLSKNLPTSWEWDFGDGQKSYLQSPVHSYAAPGKYTVTLTVSNAKGQDDEEKTYYIEVINPVPRITANASTYLGTFPLEVQFLASATVAGMDVKSSEALIKEWRWDFDEEISGIRAISHEQNPVYVYERPGTYNVTVTCTLYDGVSSVLPLKMITITPLPLASFYWYYDEKADTCCYLVKFTDTSVDADTYSWDFDDGSTSDIQNPTHRFKEVGNYNVMLTVTNVKGAINSSVQVVPITAGYDQPLNPRSYGEITASFTTGVNANGKTVNFIDQSVGEVTQWIWDFGDGTKPIILAKPVVTNGNTIHTYQRYGSYVITLTASNPVFKDTHSYTIGIR